MSNPPGRMREGLRGEAYSPFARRSGGEEKSRRIQMYEPSGGWFVHRCNVARVGDVLVGPAPGSGRRGAKIARCGGFSVARASESGGDCRLDGRLVEVMKVCCDNRWSIRRFREWQAKAKLGTGRARLPERGAIVSREERARATRAGTIDNVPGRVVVCCCVGVRCNRRTLRFSLAGVHRVGRNAA